MASQQNQHISKYNAKWSLSLESVPNHLELVADIQSS